MSIARITEQEYKKALDTLGLNVEPVKNEPPKEAAARIREAAKLTSRHFLKRGGHADKQSGLDFDDEGKQLCTDIGTMLLGASNTVIKYLDQPSANPVVRPVHKQKVSPFVPAPTRSQCSQQVKIDISTKETRVHYFIKAYMHYYQQLITNKSYPLSHYDHYYFKTLEGFKFNIASASSGILKTKAIEEAWNSIEKHKQTHQSQLTLQATKWVDEQMKLVVEQRKIAKEKIQESNEIHEWIVAYKKEYYKLRANEGWWSFFKKDFVKDNAHKSDSGFVEAVMECVLNPQSPSGVKRAYEEMMLVKPPKGIEKLITKKTLDNKHAHNWVEYFKKEYYSLNTPEKSDFVKLHSKKNDQDFITAVASYIGANVNRKTNVKKAYEKTIMYFSAQLQNMPAGDDRTNRSAFTS